MRPPTSDRRKDRNVTNALNAIAVLTSGGDAPGMNAAIRAVVRVAASHGVVTYGVKGGYKGLMSGDFVPLIGSSVSGTLGRGGTFLGSARAPRFKTDEGKQAALDHLRGSGIGGLVVIGGNGSQTGALSLHERGFPTVGVASTIDNDICGVDTSIGVDTALNTAMDMIDRLRDTASSHHRAFVIEVMGRDSGYLALMSGIATGAEKILIPEFPIELETVQDAFRASRERQKSHFIIVAAEGSPLKAAQVVEGITGMDGEFYEARLSVLGHVQRGGSPTVFDRLLATRTAAAATEALVGGKSGVVAGLSHGEITLVPSETAIQPVVKVTRELMTLAGMLEA
jgi:6-phosphofructokinase 1